MRILLADDQKDVRMALCISIQRHHPDWHLMAAASLEDLLRAVEFGCPDLLIVNWGMRSWFDADPLPHIRWENVLAAIRRHCSRLGILVLDSSPETEPLALRAGANAFICKTDLPEALYNILEAWKKPLLVSNGHSSSLP